MIYQKIAGLKRVNINHSILYNFCSEGAFSDLDMPISLFVPRPEHSVNFLSNYLTKRGIEVKDVLANLKIQLLVDRLYWISDSVRLEGCAKCCPEKINTGAENVIPPFFHSLSNKLLNKSDYTRLAATNILKLT